MAKKGLNNKFRDELYATVRKKNWDFLFKRLIKVRVRCAEDIFQPNQEDERHYNILHCIIEENDEETAAEIVQKVYKIALETPFDGDRDEEIFKFSNLLNEKGKSPLDMALERKYYGVVEILLDNEADVSTGTHSTLIDEYQNLVLKIYDRGLKFKCNPCDTNEVGWWSLEYDFQKITGRPSPNDNSNDRFRETRLLAKSLGLTRERRTDLMLHPLVQIFVGKKYRKYHCLIVFSIYYHIIWSVIGALYFMCVNTVVTATNMASLHNRSTNVTNVEPNVAKICAALGLEKKSDFTFLESGYFFWWLVGFSVVSFAKELYEWTTCPNNKYYWNQFENIGQWTTIGVLLLSSVILFCPNFILVVPLCLFMLVSIISEGYKLLKFGEDRKYFLQFKSIDKWVITGTGLCVYFIPVVSKWLWFSTTLVYIFSPIISVLFVKICFAISCRHSSSTFKNFRYFWAQLSSFIKWMVIWAQLIQLSIIPFEQPWTNIVSSVACSLGIAASLFLIQGQLTKTESYGVYNQMMMKGFKILCSFLGTFFPILAAYFVIFIILMPSNQNFSLNNGVGVGKIVAMLTGDLGFDDIFSDEHIQLIPYVVTANIAVIFFAVSVVLLLQNLLIGLTVNDLQKLRRKATAAHVANRLEVINLLETFIMSDCMLWILNKIKLHNFVIEQLSVNSYVLEDSSIKATNVSQKDQDPEDPDSIPLTDVNTGEVQKNDALDSTDASVNVKNTPESKNVLRTVKFMQLPKSVREVILENQSSYIK